MESLAHYAVVIGITGTFTIASSWLRLRSKPAELATGGRRIAPGKATAAMAIISVLLSGCVVIWIGRTDIGSGILVVGAAFTLLMAPSLTRWHDVIWNDTAIEGPSRMIGPTLGRARARILWGEIVRAGTTAIGYAFAETADKRRVYWSYRYPGAATFGKCLRLYRPDLFGDVAAAARTLTTVSRLGNDHQRQPARPVLWADNRPAGATEVPPEVTPPDRTHG